VCASRYIERERAVCQEGEREREKERKREREREQSRDRKGLEEA
jgi:hypothetical protein